MARFCHCIGSRWDEVVGCLRGNGGIEIDSFRKDSSFCLPEESV